MRHVSILALVLALVSSASARASGTSLVHGILYETYSHSPISNAVVTLTRPDLTTISTRSDSKGVFEFEGLSYGDYSLRAESPGYKPIVEELRVTSATTAVELFMPRALTTIILVHHDWPGLVNATLTSDEYSPIWSHGLFNLSGSAFQFLPFAPGLTFGTAPRMMR
jgi:hypothetical protein